MTLMRDLDHIEMEVKEIRKHLLSYRDIETATEWLGRLRDFVIATRERMEDDHR
jgi:hypothetical protein